MMKVIPDPKNFDWDKGNISKNWNKHSVHHLECEEIFFNEPIITKVERTKVERRGVSGEERISALGVTNEARLLLVVFTIREGKIRIISARDVSRKERKVYYEKTKKDTEI